MKNKLSLVILLGMLYSGSIFSQDLAEEVEGKYIVISLFVDLVPKMTDFADTVYVTRIDKNKVQIDRESWLHPMEVDLKKGTVGDQNVILMDWEQAQIFDAPCIQVPFVLEEGEVDIKPYFEEGHLYLCFISACEEIVVEGADKPYSVFQYGAFIN